jgi:DNA-directed RNA polymerase subunit RPC12/RpoP
VKESNWRIEHNCPQCGAPVTLDEADRILLCPYCRTKLYLVPGDCFRYYIPPPAGPSPDTIYIPYWRMKGLSYSVQESGVSNRFVDTNVAAIPLRGIPYSLGFRPQVFALKFVSPKTEGKFLDPHTPLPETAITSEILVSFVSEQTFALPGSSTPPRPIFHNAFIGETASVIYAPTYMENNILYDSVLRRPVCSLKTGDVDRLLASRTPQNWKIEFIATLCPECGWDLQGEKDALVMICKNCKSAWQCRGNKFERVAFTAVTSSDNASYYLPFWRMKAQIAGIKLDSYADLIRLGNLPKAITRTFEETPLYFWCPAFKVNPALFLRWARQMTIIQREGTTGDVVPGTHRSPVTLSISEAKKSISIMIADIVTDKRGIYPLLHQIRIMLTECLLEYHPFIESHNELIHANMRLSLDKKSLAYGATL